MMVRWLQERNVLSESDSSYSRFQWLQERNVLSDSDSSYSRDQVITVVRGVFENVDENDCARAAAESVTTHQMYEAYQRTTDGFSGRPEIWTSIRNKKLIEWLRERNEVDVWTTDRDHLIAAVIGYFEDYEVGNTAPDTSDVQQEVVKIDWNLAETQRMYAAYKKTRRWPPTNDLTQWLSQSGLQSDSKAKDREQLKAIVIWSFKAYEEENTAQALGSGT